jgi:hypothetical protein
MFDIEVHMTNQPGQLALLGETLGAAEISVEGGGMWLVDDVGVAHFLVTDGETAAATLERAGLTVVGYRGVVVQRLDQDIPGQLGMFCRALANAGVNIEVLYSDHNHQLVVAADDVVAAQTVGDRWMSERTA